LFSRIEPFKNFHQSKAFANDSSSVCTDELCCVVVDELHMITDGSRGPTLELALTKILHSTHASKIQIIGMSATMGGGGKRF